MTPASNPWPPPSPLLQRLHDLTDDNAPRCRGLAPEFDLDIDGEHPRDQRDRHRAAQQLCAKCPARNLCAQVIAAAPQRLRNGVWAGHIYGPGRNHSTTPTPPHEHPVSTP